jgi:hypothetical protein
MSRMSIIERGDDMIATIARQGGVYDGIMAMLAADIGVSTTYAGRIVRYVRSNPADFNGVIIEWNTIRKGYGLIVNGVSAFTDDGEHTLRELIRVYTTRIGNDERSLNMVRALRSSPSLASPMARLLKATESHLEGTVRQAEALLTLITP